MIGQYEEASLVCIWFHQESSTCSKDRLITLCEQYCTFGHDQIDQESVAPSCPDCLRIAAQITKDAKELEK